MCSACMEKVKRFLGHYTAGHQVLRIVLGVPWCLGKALKMCEGGLDGIA